MADRLDPPSSLLLTATKRDSVNLPGVPEFIKRADLDALIAALGINGDDLISLCVGSASVDALVVARDPDGNLYRTPDSKHVAQHRICIPVVD